MPPPDPQPGPAALLSQADFVRRLARALVGQDSDAEDLEQEAYLAALQHPPRKVHAGALRSWLGKVVRNSDAQRRRGAARRDARERTVARREAQPDSTRAVEQLELHELLVRRVLELSDPERTTIVLRFLEARPPAEVAQRMGVPVNTVHTRLRRALSKLREELDQASDGDRRAWCSVLAPLASLPATEAASSLTALTLGATAMKVGVAILLVVTAALIFFMGPFSGEGAERKSSVAPEDPQPEIAELTPPAAADLRRSATSVDPGRQPDASDPAGAETVTPEPPTPSWILHVVDADTLAELREVEVRQVQGWESGHFSPNMTLPAEVLAFGVDSPLDVPVGFGSQPYWVRAEGYAWKRTTVDHDVQGEVTVALRAAATIRVWCAPDDLSPLLQVRLYPGGFEGDDPVYTAQSVVPGQPAVFEDIPAGDYQVRVEVGEFFDPLVRFALQETRVEAGEVVLVHLKLDPDLVGLTPAPLAGVISVPLEALELPLELELMRAVGPVLRPHDSQRISLASLDTEGERGQFRFDFGAVTPGRVKIGLFPLRRSWVVDHPPAGNRNLTLDCGALGRVEVQVVDATTGDPLVAGTMEWSPWPGGLWQEMDRPRGSPAESMLMGMEDIRRDPLTGVGTFLAPVGSAFVGVALEGYGEDGQEVHVEAGRLNHVRFELEPQGLLLLGFVDPEGELVPASGWTLKPVDFESEHDILRMEAGRCLVTLDHGGTWRVASAPRGWELSGPAEVFVRAGTRETLDVPVRRR